MSPIKVFAVSLLFFCFITGCGGGNESPPEQLKNLSPDFPVLTPVANTLEETLDNYLDKNQKDNAAGISILVRKDGQVVYHKSRGAANINSSLAVDKNTGFHVAAISKTFTAFAIMQLYERGQLQLDNSILDYLPELSETWRAITINQMLTHSSGMHEYRNLSNQQTIDYFVLYPSLKYSPGSRAEYNNSAYVLLAEIIARISGMKFTEYMEQYIFQPAGMTDSYINNDLTPLKDKDALSFGLRDESYGIHLYTHGDTNQVSSTNDFNAFFDALYAGKIISMPTLYLMTQPRTVLNQRSYGYSMIIEGDNTNPRISHVGTQDGYSATFSIYSAYNIEYAIMACDGEKSTIDQENIRHLIEMFYKIK